MTFDFQAEASALAFAWGGGALGPEPSEEALAEAAPPPVPRALTASLGSAVSSGPSVFVILHFMGLSSFWKWLIGSDLADNFRAQWPVGL